MKKIMKYFLFGTLLTFLSINHIHAATESICAYCGTDSLPIPIGVPTFVSNLIKVFQLMIPIILIVVGMVQFMKAMASGDEKVIKSSTNSFIKSLIAGVFIFLIVAVVRFVFVNFLGSDGTSALSCISCFMDSDSCPTSACPQRDDSVVDDPVLCYRCYSGDQGFYANSTVAAEHCAKEGYDSPQFVSNSYCDEGGSSSSGKACSEITNRDSCYNRSDCNWNGSNCVNRDSSTKSCTELTKNECESSNRDDCKWDGGRCIIAPESTIGEYNEEDKVMTSCDCSYSGEGNGWVKDGKEHLSLVWNNGIYYCEAEKGVKKEGYYKGLIHWTQNYKCSGNVK